MLIIKRIRIILFVENQKQSPEVFHKNILNSQVKTCFEVKIYVDVAFWISQEIDSSSIISRHVHAMFFFSVYNVIGQVRKQPRHLSLQRY